MVKPQWGYRYRKYNAGKEKIGRENVQGKNIKELSIKYICKSLYRPDKGFFFSLLVDCVGLGSGVCSACELKQEQREKEVSRVNSSKTAITYKGIEYGLNCFFYMDPICFKKDEDVGGRRVSLPAYVVCQLLEIESHGSAEKVDPEQIKVRIRRFYRPEDISTERAYRSDVQEIYYSEDVTTVPILYIKGKCEVRTRRDFQSTNTPGTCEHIFFVEKSYDPPSKSTHLLSTTVKSEERALSEAELRKKKGKWKEGGNSNEEQQNVNPLATLDIFAGCGGLSEGLEKSGISLTKWAIEYEEPDSEAFRLNHPEALVLVQDSNVILRTIMTVCGDADDCISDEETNELAAKLDKKVISSFPRPGQVDFIIGGPPCQNFSQNAWSQIQYEKILTFLSYAEYFRPKFFLLENVPEFVSSNQGLMFQLTIASLLEMGYQVKFGILDVGAYGVSQSKKCAFIWGASPEEKLPEWPEPMHVSPGVELKITLDKKLSTRHVAVRSTSCGAPFRAITVRDTIGDLPDVKNGASEATLEYKDVPESWYQKKIRGNEETLMDHISEEMVELNLIRCEMIPKVRGADWSDLPKCKVQLDNGEFVDLIPRCSSMQQNQRKGLFGRLDWEGIFPIFSSDPHPLGEVGMCLHPEQDRMITVRVCSISGFSRCLPVYWEYRAQESSNQQCRPSSFGICFRKKTEGGN